MTENQPLDRNTIANKSKLGVIFLSLRSFGLNILKVISSLTLAKLLTPYDYGVYGVLNSWISSLSYFTDVGLHESLVQKESSITKTEVEGYLALRLILSFIVALVFSGAIYFLKDFVDVDSSSPFLLLLGFLCLLDALTTLPKVILHKNLDFKKLTILELVSSVFLYIFQISFAFMGMGFWSFFLGICVRYLVLFLGGLYLKLYYWPKFSSILKIHTSFKNGKHFQANLILVALAGICAPIILKGFLTVEVVGIYFWTMSLVSLPITYITNFGSVLFSALAKTQNNYKDSKILVSKSCRVLVLIISIVFGFGATLGPSLIDLIFGLRWALAKDVIALCSATAALLAIKELPNAVLGALGRPQVRMKTELIGFILLITLGTVATKYYFLKGFLIYSATINALIASILFYKIRLYLEKDAIKSSIKIIIFTLTSFLLTRYFNYSGSLIKSFVSFSSSLFIFMIIFDKSTLYEVRASLLRTKLKD